MRSTPCFDHSLGGRQGGFGQGADYTAGLVPWNVIAVDLNGDHKLDLAVTNYGGGLYTLLNRGDGTFNTATPHTLVGYPYFYGLVAGDFNRDGRNDVVASTNAHVSIFDGNGDGTLQPGRALWTVRRDAIAGSIAAGDLDGDGLLDLVFSSNAGVVVLLGNGDGTFQGALQYPTVAGSPPAGIAIADLNRDGRLESRGGGPGRQHQRPPEHRLPPRPPGAGWGRPRRLRGRHARSAGGGRRVR